VIRTVRNDTIAEPLVGEHFEESAAELRLL